MWISDRSVRNRTTVFAFAAILAIAGAAAYRSLPLEAAPDIKLPHVFVSTRYRGVSPEDMETSVTVKIEDKLKGLAGVRKIRSLSAEGISQIDVEFLTGTDIDMAVQKVKDKVDLARADLPRDLDDDPEVAEVNFSEWPVLILSIAGDCGMRTLTRLAEDLQREIEAVPGVLGVDLAGTVEREIQIQVDPRRLALYGLTFTQLQDIVRGENANVSGGSIRTSEGRYQLRVPSEFRTAADVEGLVVGSRGGRPVYLRDIAAVVDGTKDATTASRVNGRDSVSLSIKKRTGENIVHIVESVDALVARLRPGLPAGVTLTRLMDRAEQIRDQVWDLENNMATGFVLVVLVCCVAMGARNALVVAAIIPFSMLASFILLRMFGITLNMVVLFSLTLATGMLVDTAIVVTENAYRFMAQGVPRLEAARAATAEVAWPVIGSGLTTIAAFVPLLFWPGLVGEFMSYLPKTLILVLGSNLIIALTISPALASVFVRAKYDGPVRSAEDVTRGGEHPMLTGGGPVIGLYRWLLRLALRFRLATVALAVLVTIGAIGLWVHRVGLRNPVEFFPRSDPKTVIVNLTMPEGADFEYADAAVREAAVRVADGRAASDEERSGRQPRLRYAEALAGRQGSPSDLGDVVHLYEQVSTAAGGAGFFGDQSPNQVSVEFADLAKRSRPTTLAVREMLERVQGRGLPGVEVNIAEQQKGPPTGAPIQIEIRGDDFAVLGELADRIRGVLASLPHVRNIRDDFEPGAPTLQVSIHRARAALLGLTSQTVGFALKAAINGIEVSTWREGEKDHDITVRFLDRDRRAIETLRHMLLPTPTAGLVPLTTVARIDYVGGVGRVTRVDRQRVVTVKADVDATKTTGDTARRLAEAALAGQRLPPGTGLRFAGENEDQQESSAFMRSAFLAALLLVTLVLIWQFDALLLPLIIMSEVVLSLAGAFFGLWVYGLPFGIVMVGIGIISLAGVVVNNGIVLLDYTGQLLARGLALEEAIVAAGATRLRPVCLTAATTMLGVLPILTGWSYDFHIRAWVGASESSQWWISMAVVTIFGLGLATVLTLVVVPVLFSLSRSLGFGPFHRIRAWWRRRMPGA